MCHHSIHWPSRLISWASMAISRVICTISRSCCAFWQQSPCTGSALSQSTDIWLISSSDNTRPFSSAGWPHQPHLKHITTSCTRPPESALVSLSLLSLMFVLSFSLRRIPAACEGKGYASGMFVQSRSSDEHRSPFLLTVELNPGAAPHHEHRPIPRLISFRPLRSIFRPSHVINFRYLSPAHVSHFKLCLIASSLIVFSPKTPNKALKFGLAKAPAV